MSKQLLASETYKAYKALKAIPKGAPTFDKVDPNATPPEVIHLGEIYCRFEFEELAGELCGATFESRGALVTHIKKFHGDKVAVAASEKTGNPSMQKLNSSRAFYSTLMRTHKEKEATEKPSEPDENIPKPPPTRQSRRKKPEPLPNELPTSSEPLDPPIFKTTNKRLGQKKGAVNFKRCAAILQKKKIKMPCSGCKDYRIKKGHAPPDVCIFVKQCANGKYFNFEWEDDNNDEDEDIV